MMLQLHPILFLLCTLLHLQQFQVLFSNLNRDAETGDRSLSPSGVRSRGSRAQRTSKEHDHPHVAHP